MMQNRIFQRNDTEEMDTEEMASDRYGATAIFMYGAPAIGGFVVVMQMIRQYGVCSKMLDGSV
jgi:hypothetical protein